MLLPSRTTDAAHERSDAKSRGLSTMINAGFSLLKSLSKPKRKRDGDESDSPGNPDTDSASKRARARASGGKGAAGAGASFITSSVRKTKAKGKTPSAETGARSLGGGGVERDLRARFQSVDERTTEDGRAKNATNRRSTRTATKGGKGEPARRAGGASSGGMMGIFSPVFAYFGGAGPATRARRAAASAPKKNAEARAPAGRAGGRTTASRGKRAGAAAAARKDSAAADETARRARRTRGAADGFDANANEKASSAEGSDDASSSDDDVPVARLVSPGRDARVPRRAESLESDEAEETESDDAVLAASSRRESRGAGAVSTVAGGPSARAAGGATLGRGVSGKNDGAAATPSDAKGPAGPARGASAARANLNLAPDGSVIQNGFGKADTTLEDEYEYEDEMDESNYDEEYDPWIFIGGLPPLRSCVPKNRPRLLPPKSAVHVNKNTLVLDLDETLVHSDLEQSAGKAADFSFPVHFNNQRHVVNVKKRPFLAEFMTFAARHFEVVVFTASQRVYAERLLDTLDPDAVLVKHRLYREACVLVDGNYMKDLSAIGRDLATTVIVDNSPQAFGFQTENGVPIESWFDDPNDAQLLKLIPLLARLAASEDVRPVLTKKFNLDARVRAAEEKAEARARAEGRQL